MSMARHHAEWLSLIEVSGPFVSLPVLMRVFPQGLDAHDPEGFSALRGAFGEWEELNADPAIHTAWIRFVLRDVLGFPEEVAQDGPALPASVSVYVAEHGETLRPDVAIVDPPETPTAGKPRLLVQMLPPGQALEKPILGRRWKATPATRMMELLHGADVRLGLITNGEQWMLVDAPRGETTGFASWYASVWLDEPITLQAFRSLLRARRFFGVAENETLEALLHDSAADQQGVTDQLGKQVRRAVEILISALDRIDKDHGRTLLEHVDEKRLYESALTVMMRLVFLLSAEERGLLLLGDALYDQYYAISTLRAQLRETADQHGEEILERRHDAWGRLIATFRAVHGGVDHDLMHLPAYGGTLFDPDRFPFLEGRPAGTSWRDTPSLPLVIHNRNVLHLLEALQVLQVRVPGGPAEARLLSFRALDIEQIGHVYEGLLDHTAVRATEPVLGLSGSGSKEPEVSLRTLEEHRTRGEGHLITHIKEVTGRTERSIGRDLDPAVTIDEPRLLTACDNDPDLLQRVQPFANFLRLDSSGFPVVVTTGSVYVTQGSDRRSTGTHYTPRSLTEPIVQYTLEPLVYDGPADGKPKEEWRLRSARELLALKICDMAMGSGAFLVQACRYLSERLVEAWEEAEREYPGRVVITPEGDLSVGGPEERPIPRDPDERLAIARRIVADRCLYGVDVNPMAVEMAKLSLWLITLQRDRPFTFLDHALRCGDSLLGLDLAQILHWNLDRKETHDSVVFGPLLRRATAQAIQLRQQIEALEDLSTRETEEKTRLLVEAVQALALVRLGADLLVSTALLPKKERESCAAALLYRYQLLMTASEEIRDGAWKAHVYEQHEREIVALRKEADALLSSRRAFHWPLEFPEVFVDPEALETPIGFDAIVGNPPFMGGHMITGPLGTDYRNYLIEHIANGARGRADLCAYFLLRGLRLLRASGNCGVLATNTISQGHSREVGLDQLAKAGFTIPRAVPSRKWPGIASLEVVHVWVHRGIWRGEYMLGTDSVATISPHLTASGTGGDEPHRLAANSGKSFQGSIVLGMGFGTGKSTVALHRVQAMVRALKASGNPAPRILFTTYTNALVTASEQLLHRLLGDNARFVEVRTADSLVQSLLKALGIHPHVAPDPDLRSDLERAIRSAKYDGDPEAAKASIGRLSIDYLLEEIGKVIEGYNLESAEQYLTARRSGRRVSLNELQRRSIWAVYEQFCQILDRQGWTTWHRQRRHALTMIAAGAGPQPFDGVVIDEAQDLDPTVLRLLVELCASPNRLFITADANQSIYGSTFRWSDVHEDLNIRGRTGILRINHRSTREIGEAAESYLRSGRLDEDAPERSYIENGPLPTVRPADSTEIETALLANFLNQASKYFRLGNGGCAILCPTHKTAESIAQRLTAAGMATEYMLGNKLDLEKPVVKVLNLKSAKGLEFPIVALAGFVENPEYGSVPGVSSEEQEERLFRERRSMFVGMTRAMRALMVVTPEGNQANPLLDGFDSSLWNVKSLQAAR
jgi:superfamily I DNA/RNA helicase